MPTTQSQEFTASGTFNVPAGVSSVWVSMVAGGGGGAGQGGVDPGSGHGGGGAGEYVQMQPVKVTPGGTVAVTIGAAGARGFEGPGFDGGDSSFGSVYVRGGKGAVSGFPNRSGGLGGGTGAVESGADTRGAQGAYEGQRFKAGGTGGGGASSAFSATNYGADSLNFKGGAPGSIGTGHGGGGGAASPWGAGGDGGLSSDVGYVPNTEGDDATGYGSGGGGGGRTTFGGTKTSGGAGTGGYCYVTWIA